MFEPRHLGSYEKSIRLDAEACGSGPGFDFHAFQTRELDTEVFGDSLELLRLEFPRDNADIPVRNIR